MKKKSILFSLLLSLSLGVFAQEAAIPKLIVFPSDNWMKTHAFSKEIDADGVKKELPQYSQAFVESSELGMVIKAVEKVLEDNNFEIRSLEATLKGLSAKRARQMAAKASGNGVARNEMDEILMDANPDIRVDLGYSVKAMGPRKNISFSLQATDAYTFEPVATCLGNIELTMDPTDLAIQKFVSGNSRDFCNQMIAYYKDLQVNGRKISVTFQVAEDSSINFLKDEIGDDGDNFSDFLYSWLRKHAVNKAVKKGSQTGQSCEFETVRIPFFNEENEPIEAYDWAKKIRKPFQTETGYKLIPAEDNALGRVTLMVGAQ